MLLYTLLFAIGSFYCLLVYNTVLLTEYVRFIGDIVVTLILPLLEPPIIFQPQLTSATPTHLYPPPPPSPSLPLTEHTTRAPPLQYNHPAPYMLSGSTVLIFLVFLIQMFFIFIRRYTFICLMPRHVCSRRGFPAW